MPLLGLILIFVKNLTIAVKTVIMGFDLPVTQLGASVGIDYLYKYDLQWKYILSMIWTFVVVTALTAASYTLAILPKSSDFLNTFSTLFLVYSKLNIFLELPTVL